METNWENTSDQLSKELERQYDQKPAQFNESQSERLRRRLSRYVEDKPVKLKKVVDNE